MSASGGSGLFGAGNLFNYGSIAVTVASPYAERGAGAMRGSMALTALIASS